MEDFKDITAPQAVQVELKENGRVLWVNVNGKCVLRICQITPGTLSFNQGSFSWEPKGD